MRLDVIDDVHSLQDNTTLSQILQKIQVTRVHSVHEVFAVLDATAWAMQVTNSAVFACSSCHGSTKLMLCKSAGADEP